MNLESQKPAKVSAPITQPIDELEDFDFKPITSGLGFHHPKTTSEIKPSMMERATITTAQPLRPMQVKAVKPDMSVYQNDLSLFYGHAQKNAEAIMQEQKEDRPEKMIRTANRSERVLAYSLDLILIGSVLSIVLMMMARATGMDLMQAWTEYPNEMTPLAVTLFAGFYIGYFSIFEKSSSSTLGKGLLSIRVVDDMNQDPRFIILIMRSIITLANFASLGLFSWFDLQNKVTGIKIIRND